MLYRPTYAGFTSFGIYYRYILIVPGEMRERRTLPMISGNFYGGMTKSFYRKKMKNSIFQRLKSVHYLAADNRWALWAKEKGYSEGLTQHRKMFLFRAEVDEIKRFKGRNYCRKTFDRWREIFLRPTKSFEEETLIPNSFLNTLKLQCVCCSV